MKTNVNLFIIALTTLLFTCKNETKEINLDYKYANEKDLIICENIETKLYNEALYSFESDITKYYDKVTNNTYKAYNTFFKSSIRGKVPYEKIVSPHTMKVFNAIKAEKELWVIKNNDTLLNYNAEIFKCLSNNFIDKDLKTTFNSLVSINSMSPDLFSAPILPQISAMSRDKYLTAYIALDHYYSRLFYIDSSQIIEIEDTEVIINETKSEQSKIADPHAGHNHD